MVQNNDQERPSKPSTHNGDFNKLSPALLSAVGDLKIFVLWKWAKRAGKWTKPLLRADDPTKNAKSNDPSTWCSFRDAVASFQANAARVAGIGLVLTNTALAGVDLDHCRNPDGTVDAWAKPILKRALNEMAYVEISVSGTGFHIVGLADRQPLNKRVTVTSMSGAHPDAAVEVYYKTPGRYFTLSGMQHGRTGTDLPDISDFVGDVVAQVTGERLVEDVVPKGAPKGERSEEFNRVVWSLAAEGMNAEQIAAELEKHPSGIASKYEGRLEGEVKRSYEKWKEKRGVSLEDFYGYSPHHNFLFVPTREPWPGSTVDARILPVILRDKHGKPLLNKKNEPLKIPASVWLMQNRVVEQMTWWPGMPEVIENKVVSGGGMRVHPGVSIFNLYHPPTTVPGIPSQATKWVDLVRKTYPDDWEHIICWLAFKVQNPGTKINHALVLGGDPGIGKDTILEPVKRAVGYANFAEIGPHHVFESFNSFVKSVVLRISEARDLGDTNRFQFYDRLKTLTASPPDVLRCNEKNLREHYVVNCCGVIITMNRKDSLHLVPDDRRHYVAWSNLTQGDFTDQYWDEIYQWYSKDRGYNHVIAHLRSVDLSKFNANAPPKKTPVFWEIVEANAPPEDSDLADILEEMGSPDAVTLQAVMDRAKSNTSSGFYDWIGDRKNRRAIPHRMGNCGYVPIRNTMAKDGGWVVKKKRQVIYAKSMLSYRDQMVAVANLLKTMGADVIPFPVKGTPP